MAKRVRPPDALGIDITGRIPGLGTTVVGPDEAEWRPAPGAPERSFEMAPLIGSYLRPEFYACYARWYPGWMSAPHTYEVDRFAVVSSGVWTVGAGAEIDLAQTIPMRAGEFSVRRAGTPHYDGALPEATEPAVFVLFGMGPAVPALADSSDSIYVRL
ncbi:hypothetical protein [Nocardia huaxiensis]|uniref:Cupin n=1 Tax=Nocardia huaxiensis TaxID=2755382 RepID=A0A7D6ZQF0_9NOCA|nr:hypothetical protein [Nocardia huaxiensis]QLY31205.1 hypothetical protein H0264_02115 [Nocardia huaxiensis]UFS94736.1 hypothetical protein LPY97_28950 [Nocardia huaxiensis]